MKNELELTVNSRAGRDAFSLAVDYLWNGGWAGRDQADIQKHIDELVDHGIAGPSVTPIYFPLSNNLVTTAGHIQVVGPESSGEVEYVLLFTDRGTLVGLASDHTDRAFERHGIQASKQMYPNVMSADVWPLDEVHRHWDSLELRCWVVRDGERREYQRASLSELLSVDQWLEIIEPAGIARPGTVFLSGAPPTLSGLVFGQRFEIELHDPQLNRLLRHAYDVELLPTGVQ